MTPTWSFRKKSVEGAKALKIEENKVVEYESETKGDKDKKTDSSHLTN
jgi:hypothetical protein